MKNLSNRFGNALRKLGFSKGDRFLMRLPNVPEFQMVFLGGVKIGAVPIPSSTMFKAKEIEYRILDSDAIAVITTPEGMEDVDKIKGNCPTLKHIIIVGDELKEGELSFYDLIENESTELEIEDTDAEDMAFFCYTSGTTGMPKGAVHAHRWVIGNDPASQYWQTYRPDDIMAHTGALNWIFPLGNAFLYAWRHKTTVFLYDGRFEPEIWFSLLEKYKVTNLASVPTCYRMFLTIEDAEKRYDLGALRHCISAGEPLNPEVVKEWRERFNCEILDGIGMTEVMVYLSNITDMPIKPGSCGRPQPGHVCEIVDDDANPVPPNVPGTLAVSQDDPGLFKEYWNKPEKTSKSFKNGWFLSGDTLYKDKEGYFWFSGRGDDLIMTAGYRVSPFEVESVVNHHPAVLESAAVASPDEVRGVIVKSFIILNEGYEPSDELAKNIQRFVRKNTAPYKYPREIDFVESLPKTQSGKTKRKLLREKEIEQKMAPGP
jgi:acyl-coenzyme A synthetase/AMP-(fatty) acid ligase